MTSDGREDEPDDLLGLGLKTSEEPVKELVRARNPTPLDVSFRVPLGRLGAESGCLGPTRRRRRGRRCRRRLSCLLRLGELRARDVLNLGREVLSGVARRVGPGCSVQSKASCERKAILSSAREPNAPGSKGSTASSSLSASTMSVLSSSETAVTESARTSPFKAGAAAASSPPNGEPKGLAAAAKGFEASDAEDGAAKGLNGAEGSETALGALQQSGERRYHVQLGQDSSFSTTTHSERVGRDRSLRRGSSSSDLSSSRGLLRCLSLLHGRELLISLHGREGSDAGATRRDGH